MKNTINHCILFSRLEKRIDFCSENVDEWRVEWYRGIGYTALHFHAASL